MESTLRRVYKYTLNLCFLVSRIEAKSQIMKIDIELDVNTDIYPMEKDAYYSMVLANSVNQDGSEDFDILRYDHQGAGGAAHDGHGSLLDQYQYVMQGKVFKYALKDQKM